MMPESTGFCLGPQMRSGVPVVAAWISSGLPRIAEILVSAGFDAAVFDMQHGEGSLAEIRDGIQAVRLAGRPSSVRLALGAEPDAARMLDLGAELVIMPMVDTPEQARRLVKATKYPPLGGRSWGGGRAAALLGLDAEVYRVTANQHVIVMAMIETRAAVDALETILDVDGLDGVFIGPSDLSISLSNGVRNDHLAPEVAAVKARVLAEVRRRGKLAGTYCAGGAAAAQNAALGFNLLGVGSDVAFLAAGAREALEAARGPSGSAEAGY